MPAKPGQIYQQCDPHAPHIRLRIMTVGPNRAEVFYMHTGRAGRILLNALHDSAVTKTGKPRRTGYALETK
ncbi:hypothetical protein [Kitasatospora sp. NBC_01302]|uniref:hypothetical protein n=1 Tax=Kitasatospora sp. NBC_01302 TaxID=2903575 RepID=UPI002E0DA069|nr:hypothetical protein OG294_13970 [Kitasatospora sp. NBC_01302]